MNNPVVKEEKISRAFSAQGIVVAARLDVPTRPSKTKRAFWHQLPG